MSQWKAYIHDRIKKQSQWIHELEASDHDDATTATRHFLEACIEELNQKAGHKLYEPTDYLILKVEPDNESEDK